MMKRLIPLLAGLLLLCGCAGQTPTESMLPDSSLPASSGGISSGLYLPGSSLEQDSGGAIRVYSTGDGDLRSFLPMGDCIISFSPSENGTLLTRLEGDSLICAGTYMAESVLSPEDNRVQAAENGISFFCTTSGQTVILDAHLQERHRIDAPEGMTGVPLLSADRGTLYYCTGTAVRALDLNAGISRILKESSYPAQSVSGLLLEDSVLEISITDTDGQMRTLYLDTASGQLLQEQDGQFSLESSGNHYFTRFQVGASPVLLFGSTGEPSRMLLPEDPDSDCWFLPNQLSAVTVSHEEDHKTLLSCYDLETGMRTASITLGDTLQPAALHGDSSGNVWMLAFSECEGREYLYRWNPALSPLSDSTLYTSPYFTRENPDYEGLAACSLYARQIGEAHGVEVLIYKDAVETEPWDYDFQYEYQVPVLKRELKQLETRLGNFPPGIFQTLSGKFTGIKICIVHSLTGSPESGSPEQVSGIQFWNDYDAHIVLAAGEDTEKTLYHELCHLIDTVVLTESTAYDRWESLNPSGFAYDMDYTANRERDGSAWLRDGQAAFIDTYSMSYPKEDRARILEYAMTPGNRERFQSPILQKKLYLLCTGIRDAFCLTGESGAYLWEQYLLSPISSKS